MLVQARRVSTGDRNVDVTGSGETLLFSVVKIATFEVDEERYLRRMKMRMRHYGNQMASNREAWIG